MVSEQCLFDPPGTFFACGSSCNHLYSEVRVRQPFPEFLMAVSSWLLYFKPYLRSNFLPTLESSVDKEALEITSQSVLHHIPYNFSNSFSPKLPMWRNLFLLRGRKWMDIPPNIYIFFVLYLVNVTKLSSKRMQMVEMPIFAETVLS